MRQCLEANKMKYVMMGELLASKGEIQERTFFDNKRQNETNTNGSFKNQILEQLKINHKAALAMKYGMLWLQKVRDIRKRKEMETIYKQ